MKDRKHGYKARAATIARWLTNESTETVETTASCTRLKTQLTFTGGSCVWTTDRGRSRLIKH